MLIVGRSLAEKRGVLIFGRCVNLGVGAAFEIITL